MSDLCGGACLRVQFELLTSTVSRLELGFYAGLLAVVEGYAVPGGDNVSVVAKGHDNCELTMVRPCVSVCPCGQSISAQRDGVYSVVYRMCSAVLYIHICIQRLTTGVTMSVRCIARITVAYSS